MEKQHVATVTNKDSKRSINRTIKFLDEEVKRIEEKINQLIHSDKTIQEKVNRLTSIKGIGPAGQSGLNII